MKITKKDVEYVAKLARLALTEEEKEKFCSQLNQILLYMEKLNELETKDVPPTSHVLALKNVWREDEVKPFTHTKEILKNAPEKEGNYFKVKKVIE
ncbi:MAG TPA: Asp-tRNA(Asn)/Glu-tRNA(Gln) amidotransferase subunit GatB [Elusimicrobia bacterium]|jgi:aspartyl-tRNA(Asn)/glutamyl-tRNA(Gln) amidotransferase subunit C|nr:Asp-tRNA(Asn)/Glu-tRNA(Gln) amidotransferase subunit GatB [Elusimicrobiota bacterium]